jgi:hypothetical protein
MSENKYLIITGAAPSVLDDVEAVPKSIPVGNGGAFFSPAYDYMLIGLTAAGMHAIPCKYMATYHPTLIPEVKVRREAAGGNTDYIIISHEARPGVSIIEPLLPGERSGSSALLGAQAALKLGYSRIILCGCPLEGKNASGGAYDSFRIGWINKQKFLNDRVRSMSGWTKELLGAPTDEWLLSGLENG